MEGVILFVFGLPGTTKSSLTWSSGGNKFSFCLNKDLGGTLGRELNMDFFLTGLLEIGELLRHLYTLSTCVASSVISLCSLSIWSAVFVKTLSPSKNFSFFVQFPLHSCTKRTKQCSPCWREIPARMTTLRLYFAFWNGHRRISGTFHIQILHNKFTSHTLKKLFSLYTLFTDVNFFTGVIETLLTKFAFPHFDSITRRIAHHCPTWRHVKFIRKQTDPTKDRFGELSCFKIARKWGS